MEQQPQQVTAPTSSPVQVRRARPRADSEEPLRGPSLLGTDSLVPGSVDGPDDEAYEDLSESPSVLTLYFSQQETIISSEETDRMTAECNKEEEDEEKKQPAEDYKFRFTRAPPEKGARSRSAPARPLTELEEFKESREFTCLETAALDAGDILQRDDGKFDLDSNEGHESCRRFLEGVEALSRCFGIRSTPRKYRAKFSQAYRVLYKEGELCYLAEILDSAQEGFPYIVVNSEKYVFSPNVLRSGEQLYATFLRLRDYIRDSYNM